MKAIILAAGVGSRLKPITNHVPKSLVRVGNKRIIDYQIEGYLAAGLSKEDIYVVTGYLSDLIKKHLSKKFAGVKVIENSDYASTNNMYSLYLAMKELQIASSELFFINNADCIYESQVFVDLASSDSDNLIACKKGIYIDESMKIIVENNRILNISKQISEIEAYGVSVDLYKFDFETFRKLQNIIIRIIEEEKRINLWTELAFPELFESSLVYPLDIGKLKWVEVDNNEDLLVADATFSHFTFQGKKAILCDLDGTLYIGDTPIPSAVKYINENPDNLDLYFFSNNTSRTPQQFIDKLKGFGITAVPDQIITPLKVLVNYIKNKGFHSIFLVANRAVTDYLSEQLPLVSFAFNLKENDLIVLTYDTEIAYDKLKKAAILINRKDTQYWATHSDVYCPNEQGPIPDIGSFIQLLKSTTGREPDLIFGKPSLLMLEPLMNRYKPDDLFIVGDRLYTDMKLALTAGCDFVCVLSGETNRCDIAMLQEKDGYPSLIVNTLGETHINL